MSYKGRWKHLKRIDPNNVRHSSYILKRLETHLSHSWEFQVRNDVVWVKPKYIYLYLNPVYNYLLGVESVLHDLNEGAL